MLRTLLPHLNPHAHGLPAPLLCVFAVALLSIAGCHKPEPIRNYVIPTEIPPELRPEKDRMLAAMIPLDNQVWFFKVTGPESAIESIASSYRQYVQSIEFDDGEPDLNDLPADWRLGGKKTMRFATIDVNTPSKQLDISVSSLSRQEDWDEQVAMNVNRWRDQLGLETSKADWAGAEKFEVASADGESVWVDLIGDTSSGGSSMSPPMMGARGGSIPPVSRPAAQASEPNSRLKSERPDGWRDGKKSSMRWASFNVGPEESQAEVTVIPAGGDLRGNVKRWIGQIRADVPEEVVDKAIEDAEELKVGGRDAQRFILNGDEKSTDETSGEEQGGQSIDATIVPLEDDFSLFIKMTGPTETVTEQHDALTSFLESLEF